MGGRQRPPPRLLRGEHLLSRHLALGLVRHAPQESHERAVGGVLRFVVQLLIDEALEEALDCVDGDLARRVAPLNQRAVPQVVVRQLSKSDRQLDFNFPEF